MATNLRNGLGEFALIERYFRPLAGDPGAFELSDDAALIRAAGEKGLVVTSDMIMEGVHFFADDPPASIARKALRVNLSDLAAKGARPVGYFLSIGVPDRWERPEIAAFARGLRGDQERYGVTLLGGDTTRSPSGVVISITAFGQPGKRGMIRRAGARPGDHAFVTGTIGDAALGLQVRRGELPERGAARLVERYLHPQPRVELAASVARYARAALDVSDGLWADLTHLCRTSGVTTHIEGDQIPLSPAASRLVKDHAGAFRTVVTGGDDYELLLAVAPRNTARFIAAANDASVPVRQIGTLVEGRNPPTMNDHLGRAMEGMRGHQHF